MSIQCKIIYLATTHTSKDIFLALVTGAAEVGNTRPSASSAESVAKIHEISFFCINSSTWDDLNVNDTMPGADEAAASSSQVFEHPCAPLTKILSSGSFYYAVDTFWDLSSRLSKRQSRSYSTADLADFDERFVWNEFIVRSLLDFRNRLDTRDRDDFDLCHFIVGPFTILTTCLYLPETVPRSLLSRATLVSSPWPFPRRPQTDLLLWPRCPSYLD